MSTPISKSLQLVEECQAEVQKQLSGADHNRNLLAINTNFRIIKEHLKFMGGTLEPEKFKGKPSNERFPPMKTFMGKALKPALDSKKAREEMIAGDDEKEKYAKKVAMLYGQFLTLGEETILKSYRLPEDVLVVRGVAKKAGVEGYEKKPLDAKFIEEIKVGIELKNEEGQTLKDISDATGNKPEEHTVTVEMINKDPELKALKAKPGDKVLFYPDGTREFAKPTAPAK